MKHKCVVLSERNQFQRLPTIWFHLYDTQKSNCKDRVNPKLGEWLGSMVTRGYRQGRDWLPGAIWQNILARWNGSVSDCASNHMNLNVLKLTKLFIKRVDLAVGKLKIVGKLSYVKRPKNTYQMQCMNLDWILLLLFFFLTK